MRFWNVEKKSSKYDLNHNVRHADKHVWVGHRWPVWHHHANILCAKVLINRGSVWKRAIIHFPTPCLEYWMLVSINESGSGKVAIDPWRQKQSKLLRDGHSIILWWRTRSSYPGYSQSLQSCVNMKWTILRHLWRHWIICMVLTFHEVHLIVM